MKTILVLTDFTLKDDHAAHYALKLAQQLKANVLLCNVYPEMSTDMASGKPVFINEMYDNLETQSKNDLSELAGRLKKQLAKVTDTWFKPEITQYSKGGSLTGAINELVAGRNILMAVIAMHSADDFFTFFNIDHASEIIEKANCPVLVLPYQLPFLGFNKIAFASDLDHHNMNILKSLYGLSKHFDAEILITHVGVTPLGRVSEAYIIKQCLQDELTGTKPPKIQYRSIQNKNVVEGLDWLAEHTDIDLMVLVHRKRNIFQKLFKRSITKKLASHRIKPMLVFPGHHKNESLPLF
ncbi:MAG: universal stress protein [Bacteroidota bacterium]